MLSRRATAATYVPAALPFQAAGPAKHARAHNPTCNGHSLRIRGGAFGAIGWATWWMLPALGTQGAALREAVADIQRDDYSTLMVTDSSRRDRPARTPATAISPP
jgi:hypothetical protein